MIHKISDLADVVIEAGGPTVRRSLNEPAYFSTVIQLSLLTWTHDLQSLARSLVRALELRAKGATKHVALPTYDALKGTLRACREQTSGFMWELFFSAVERKLSGRLESEEPYDARPLPVSILQALLDSLTAVQHLPENTLLKIRTMTGVITIVVWAHHTLGLTVAVETVKEVVQFGDGSVSVYVDCRVPEDDVLEPPEACLLNEAKDVMFRVSESIEDPPLEPVCRHPVFNYGTRTLERSLADADAVRALAHGIISSCIILVRETSAHFRQRVFRIGKDICPSPQEIYTAGRLLFPEYDQTVDSLVVDIQQQCLATSSWQNDEELPVPLVHWIREGGSRALLGNLTRRLAHILLVISMTTSIDNCKGLSIDLYSLGQDRCSPFHLPDAREAFESMALLLQGKESYAIDNTSGLASVISAWGWSLCVSSINCMDPSQIRSRNSIIQGVPMRSGERKRVILDSFKGSGSYQSIHFDRLKPYQILAQFGDQVSLDSWTRSRNTRFFIGVSETAFQVAMAYEVEALNGEKGIFAGRRYGFRSMQETYWNSGHLLACEHPVQLGQVITVPQNTYIFRGFEEPQQNTKYIRNGTDIATGLAVPPVGEGGFTHVALVAGDRSGRWLLLSCMSRWSILTSPGEPKILLRGDDCCFKCAVDVCNENGQGGHIGLVL